MGMYKIMFTLIYIYYHNVNNFYKEVFSVIINAINFKILLSIYMLWLKK